MRKLKTTRQMERHLKGISNHYRIEILILLSNKTNLTLEEIIDYVKANPKTIGEHTRRLYHAGLVDKKYNGKYVEHKLSPYGKKFTNFLKSFQNF